MHGSKNKIDDDDDDDDDDEFLTEKCLIPAIRFACCMMG